MKLQAPLFFAILNLALAGGFFLPNVNLSNYLNYRVTRFYLALLFVKILPGLFTCLQRFVFCDIFAFSGNCGAVRLFDFRHLSDVAEKTKCSVNPVKNVPEIYYDGGTLHFQLRQDNFRSKIFQGWEGIAYCGRRK